MRSTFPGTELDFRLKLTRRTKNNPSQERQRKTRTGGEGIKKNNRRGKRNDGRRERIKG